MAINLVKSQLRSSTVRRKLGNNGIRRISTNYKPATSKQGFLSKIWNATEGLRGWISSKLGGGFRNLNFTKIWDWIVAGASSLWTFNWQQTDEEIDKKIEQEWHAVSVKMAGLTGRAFGHLVCGFIPSLAMVKLNFPLGVYLLQKVGEEALQDLSNEFNQFMGTVGRATLNTAARNAFKNVRGLIKKANRNPKYRKIVSQFVDPTIIDKWGEEKGKEWSFQSFLQKQIEKLPEPWQDRAEEFLDEFGDACVESGYVLAGGLDEYFGLNAATQGIFSPFGQERTVEFYPNKDVKSEKFILQGREDFIKSQIIDIVNQKQLLDNREITLSLPTEEWGRIPITETGAIEIELEFYKFEQPSYWTKERRGKNGRQRIHLYNIDRTKIKFSKLQQDFRKTSFTTGAIKTSIRWTNGRQTHVYVSTQNEGERIAKVLESYTKENIVFPLVFTATKGQIPGRSRATTLQNHKQYLATIKIWNWDRITKYEKTVGKPNSADRKRLIQKFQTHFENEPSTWQQEVNEVLKNTL